MSRAAQFYNFALNANASQEFLVTGSYFKILTSTGSVRVTLSDGSNLNGIVAGQGMRESEFQRVTLTDLSGAPNSGQFVVASVGFVDDRVVGTVVVSSITNTVNTAPTVAATQNIQGVAPTVTFNNAATAYALGVPEVIVAPGTNVNGLIVTGATIQGKGGATNGKSACFMAKATAPTGYSDAAAMLLLAGSILQDTGIALPMPQRIPAGMGLYFLCDANIGINGCVRALNALVL
jgi:hypothetical protein